MNLIEMAVRIIEGSEFGLTISRVWINEVRINDIGGSD